MKYETAESLAISRFTTLHPKETWPEWFIHGATLGGYKNASHSWIMQFTAVQKQILPPHQHWETRNNRKVLVEVDPETNNKFVVLHWSVPDSAIMTIFKAEINPVTQEVMVLIDTDLSAYHSDEIEWSNPDGK